MIKNNAWFNKRIRTMGRRLLMNSSLESTNKAAAQTP
jgi:hypothetical protein